MNSFIDIRFPEKMQDGLRNKVIGITGNPGSGKTSVSLFLKENGASVLSGDNLGYAMLEPDSPAYPKIVEAFGHEILDAEKKLTEKN